MRAVLRGSGVLWLAVLSGCAPYRLPNRIVSTDWATVAALSPGTAVAVDAGEPNYRIGDIDAVTEGALILREGLKTSTILRAAVQRVTVRDPAGARTWPRVVKGALIGAAIAAPIALLLWENDEHGSARGDEAMIFALGPAIGTAIGLMRPPQAAFHERIVYIRP